METDYKVKLEVFEGPLDLLLYLIKRDEIDIYDMSIERITRQYLEYLQAFKELKIDIAGEFVVMAANLIYLKSRSLLPLDQRPPEEDAEEDDPRWGLIRQLIEYKKFKEAAAQLHIRELEQERIFTRNGGSSSDLDAPLRLGEVGIFQLIHAFQNVVRRVEAREDLREIFGDRFTVSEKIDIILQRLAVNISDADQVAARSGNFDAVIHCASTGGGDVDLYRRTYLRGASNLLGRFSGSTMLFTSSTSVYAQRDGELVTEESAAEPEHEGGKILRETEQLVLNRGGIVARLAGIYGPGRSYLVERILSGEVIVDPKHDRFVNQVHRDDAVAALFLLLERPLVRPEIYNVVDDEPILQSECYRWLAEKLHRPLPRLGTPTSVASDGSTSKPKRGE